MSQKNISSVLPNELFTSDDILGKDVIDAEGKFIGITENLYIDPKTLEFVGVLVDKGFLKKGLRIGKGYIRKITSHAIFLNIKVLYEMRGKEVFDKNGKKIGNVTDIKLWGNKNKIHTLYVNSNIGYKLLGKHMNIPAEMIDTIENNVILNVSEKELFSYLKIHQSQKHKSL